MKQLTAVIEKDIETGYYIGIVPGLPGAHTQAETLEELYFNLNEVIELCLQELSEEEIALIPQFIGTHQVEISA